MNLKAINPLFAILLAVPQIHAGTLEVDQSRSRIQVDAHATGHDFTGTLRKYAAKVSGDATSLKPAGFELNWSFRDLKTGDEKRDAEMLKWLGGGDPKGSFRFTKSWTDKTGKTFGMGTLKIHGVSKDISFPYTAARDGSWVTIDGTATIDYGNFDLPVVRALVVMTVDPRLKVQFHIVGKVK